MGWTFFYPACWILSDRRTHDRILAVLMAAAMAAGVAFIVRGASGTGEGVHYLWGSGLRIASRVPNIFAVALLMLLARIYASGRRPGAALSASFIIVMTAGLILSGTRTLWAGVAVAALAAWLLGMARTGRGGRTAHLWRLAGAGVLAAAALGLVTVLGITSAGQLGQRIGGAEYSLPIDIGLLSRLLSWSAVLEQSGGAAGLLFGRGMGATVTYFKPEFLEMRTMSFVDGSFWQALLNTGVLGALLLLALLLTAAVKSARLFLSSTDDEARGGALGLFCAFAVLLAASLMSSVTTNYNYTALWGCLLAMLHVEESLRTGR